MTNIYEIIIGGSLAAILATLVIMLFRFKMANLALKKKASELETKDTKSQNKILELQLENEDYKSNQNRDGIESVKSFERSSVFDELNDL